MKMQPPAAIDVHRPLGSNDAREEFQLKDGLRILDFEFSLALRSAKRAMNSTALQ
jgi:hypothetical protein